MKFHLQTADRNLVTDLGDGWIKVGGTEFRENCVLTPEGVQAGFAKDGFAALTESDFAQLLELRPEIVLLGTGATQRFPQPAVVAPLLNAQVGLEVMDTRAACRTYNILVAEGRSVTAALIVE